MAYASRKTAQGLRQNIQLLGAKKVENMNFFSMVRMMFNAITKPKQHIVIQEIPKGRVIDIGGGGEGVIAQAGGAEVVAVDKYLSEIDEARGKATDASWMVADAAELPFKGQSFDHATAFFSCMYMTNEVKEKVFRETRRMLKKGGEFWVWDIPMSLKSKAFAIRLQVDIPGKHTFNTAYGVKAKDQSAASICNLLQATGFEPEVITDRKHWFLIKAKSLS
jgi:ubiquinone/menaquinone biosynthesis C-methylase UbiE